MDQITLVGEQIDDGLKLIKALNKQNIKVEAASWIRAADEDKWYLYIATPIMNEGSFQAYRRVHGIIRNMESPFWVDPFEVKLIDLSDPIVTDISNLYLERNPTLPTRYGGPNLGGESIEAAYIYPPTLSSTTRKSKRSR